ncbi:MAG TPA: DUF1538 domain-containing protein [Candidatus Binatia bacterium]
MSGALTLSQIGRLAWDVVLAVLPLVVLFATFQVFFLKLPGREVRRILTGTAIAAVGLFLFLFGVNLGFLPFGRAIGEAVGTLPSKWMMGAFGLVLGFVTTWGEPAVRILADQVEEASAGSIRSSLVLAAICIGVAVAVCLGMLRIAYGITLLYILVPSYGLVVAMIRWSHPSFVSISIDAGGVATGPLANTFLLALALGAASTSDHSNPLVHGLGLVALIAVAPLVSVMALGLLVRRKEPRKES